MPNVTPDYLRGFLVPLGLNNNNLWLAQSSFTVGDSIAGDPIPTGYGPMRLIATGNQTTGSDLTIKTQKSGYAGYGAGFIFEDNQTSVNYGRDPQNTISRFKNLYFSRLSSTVYSFPSGLDTGEGDLLISYARDTTSNRTVRVTTLKIDDTSSDVSIYSESTTLRYALLSGMCKLSDGSYLLAHLAGDDETVNLRTYHSTDGTTWTLRTRRALPEALNIGTLTGSGAAYQNHNPQRLRIAEALGVVMIMIETIWNDTSATKRNRLLQYASSDMGGSFSLVTTSAEIDDHSFRSISLYSHEGVFRFCYAGATNEIHYMTIPSAYISAHRLRDSGGYHVISQTVTGGTSNVMTGGDISAWTDEGASHHISARRQAGGGDYRIYWSQDAISFREMGRDQNGAGRLIRTGDDSSQIENSFGLTWSGRSIILCEPVSTAANYSISMLYLGGYSSVTLPSAYYSTDQDAEWNRLSFAYNYPGLDLYSNFTGVTTAGAGTESLDSGGVRIDRLKNYTVSPSMVGIATSEIIPKGMIVRARISSMIGGDNVNDIRGIRIKTDDTTDNYDAELRVSPSAIVLVDNIAASNVFTISGLSLSDIDLLIALSGDDITVYYRDIDSINNKRRWTTAGTGTLSSGGGGASNLNEVKWGHLAWSGGPAAFETIWSDINFSRAPQIGDDHLVSFSSPGDLFQRAYPPTGNYAYVSDNVRISGTDGATYEGDQFSITPTSNFKIENVLYDISPTRRVYWRSESVISGNVPEQFIAFKLDPDTSVHIDESLPNDYVGLHLQNYNFITGKLEYYSSGTWTVLDTFSGSISSECLVQGRTVRGANTAPNQPYFRYNECAGWRVRIETGEESYVWRTVVSNSEGRFGGTTTGTKQAVLLLDESLTGLSPSEIELIPNSMTLIVNLNGLRLEALGLRIPAQTTLENYAQIGILHLGSVLIPGKQYQRGRTISIDSGTVSSETQDGIVYTKNNRPSRRTFRIAWTEGVDLSDLQGDNPDPNYWIGSSSGGAEPIAIANDVPYLLQGLLKYLQGEKTPIVYLPLIDKTTDQKELHRDYEQALVSVQGEIEVENILGDENVSESGELVRIATMTLREIL